MERFANRRAALSATLLMAALAATPAHGAYLSRVDALQPQTPVPGTDFGRTVAAKHNNPSGDVAVTAGLVDFNEPGAISSVFVFESDPAGGWRQRSLYSHIDEFDAFGGTLEITPQHLIVGLPSVNDDGWVNIYRRVPGVVTGGAPPQLLQALFPESAGGEAFFANGMDQRNGVLAVIARGSEGSTQEKVHVYRLRNGLWRQEQILRQTYSPSMTRGTSVSTDGVRIAANGPNGRSYVYRHTARGWVTEQVFDRAALGGLPVLGLERDSEISIDGGWLAIKVPGKLLLFRRATGSNPWQLRQTLSIPVTASSFDVRGLSPRLVLRGGRLLLGLPGEGRALIYQAAGGVWQQARELLPGGAAPGGLFGRAVDFGLDLAVVGAQGAAYVFRSEVDLSALVTTGNVAANGEFDLIVKVTNGDTEIRATDVQLRVTLPPNLTAAAPGSCNTTRSPIRCRLGQVAQNGGTRELSLRLRPIAAGAGMIRVEAYAAQPDLNPADNESVLNVPLR